MIRASMTVSTVGNAVDTSDNRKKQGEKKRKDKGRTKGRIIKQGD